MASPERKEIGKG